MKINMKMIKKFIEYARSVRVSKSVFFAIVPVLLMTGFAIASIDTEVTACVNNKNGAVRIINFLGGDCGKTETQIIWNKQGPIGPVGPQGPAGVSLSLKDISGQDMGILIDSQRDADGERFTSYFPEQGVFMQTLART